MQVASSLHAEIAVEIVGQIVFEDGEQLLQLLVWDVLAAIVNNLLEVVYRDIWFALLQEGSCASSVVEDEELVFIKQDLRLLVWDIIAILLEFSHDCLVRDVLFVLSEQLLQLSYGYILLIVANHLFEFFYRVATLEFLNEQLDLLVRHIFLVFSNPIDDIVG